MASSSEYLNFLRRQRQTRDFTTDPVSDDDLQAILETIRWTGSSGNSQPWKFLVVRDPETKEHLGNVVKWTKWIAQAPVVIVVVTEGPDPRAHTYDLGRINERILLAAQALGLGAGVSTFFTEQGIREAKAILRVPDDWSVYSAVAIGHPAGRPRTVSKGGRKPLEELVLWDRFDSATTP
jgi:nitroreductase